MYTLTKVNDSNNTEPTVYFKMTTWAYFLSLAGCLEQHTNDLYQAIAEKPEDPIIRQPKEGVTFTQYEKNYLNFFSRTCKEQIETIEKLLKENEEAEKKKKTEEDLSKLELN